MTAPVIDPLPSAPSRGSESREQFVLTTDAFLGSLGPFVTQVNLFGEYLNDFEVGAISWGAITGDLSDQTDLVTELLLKAPVIAPTFATSVTLAFVTGDRLLAVDSSKRIISLSTTTWPSVTELSYVKGVTSAVQTQLNAKAPATSPTFATSITGSYLTASELLGTDGSKNIVSLAVATYPSLAELAYVKGVTSAIQTQLDAKSSASPTLIATQSTASGASVSFTSIPQTYKTLLFEILGITHDSGSNQTPQCELSGSNGSTWTGTVALTGASVGGTQTLYGALSIAGYIKDAGQWLTSLSNLTADETQTGSNLGRGTAWRIAGGIDAVRFSFTASNFDGGSINLWGL